MLSKQLPAIQVLLISSNPHLGQGCPATLVNDEGWHWIESLQ